MAFSPISENEHPPIGPSETVANAFTWTDDAVLSPPRLNWTPLELFCGCANVKDLTDRKRCPRLSKLCLIDDRSGTSQQQGVVSVPCKETHSVDRDVSSEDSLSQSFSNDFRKVLDERDLYERLLQNRSMNCADRRVLYGHLSGTAMFTKTNEERLITNLTPLCATALGVTVAHNYVATLKAFLHSHITSEIYFFASAHNPCYPCQDDIKPSVHENFKVSLGFHLSYVALRQGCPCSDPRGIRQSYSMISSLDDHTDELFCYDAEVSFLLTEVDELHWTAYCCVDTYFGSEQDVNTYLFREQDGPSGGAQNASQPCWNPREYFLLVLSQRMRQISREWGSTFAVLMARLDSYESHYVHTIDTDDLFDDAGMTRIRSYSKAASMLRQFHDTLFTTLTSLERFLDENVHFFEIDQQIDDRWKCYFDIITGEERNLQRWQCRLLQRMKRFDGMKEGLVNSSILQESRRSTRQGDDIGVLTNMTVVYLPFSLAASIFSISNNSPKGIVWAYWTATSLVLGLATFYFAFWRRHKIHWSQRGREERKR